MADNSFYANALGNGQSLFDYAHKYLAVQRELLANESAKQKFAAQQAYGKIVQSAIDPQTGELNYNKAFQSLSSNPQTSFMAPDFLNQAVARQATQAETALKELEGTQKRYATFGSGASALLSMGDNLTRADVAKQAVDYRNDNLMSTDELVDFIKSIPADKGPVLQNFVKQIAVRGQSSADAMKNVLGEYESVRVGDGTQFVRKIPGQPLQNAGFVGDRPSLEQQNALVDMQNNAGDVVPVNRSAVSSAPMNMGGRMEGFAQPQPQTQPTPSAARGARRAEEAGMADAFSPDSSTPRPLVKSLGDFGKKRLAASAEYSKELNNSVETGNAQLRILNELDALSQKIQTGGGAEARADAAKLAQAFGNFAIGERSGNDWADYINSGDTSAVQEFKNLAFQFAVEQMKSSLAGDKQHAAQELQNFVDNKININNDPRAIKKMLKYYSDNVKIKQREQQFFEKWLDQGKDPAKFQAYWAKNLRDAGWIKPIEEK